jgi:hypothetical protein
MEKGRERKKDRKPDRQEEDSERQEYVRQADYGPDRQGAHRQVGCQKDRERTWTGKVQTGR